MRKMKGPTRNRIIAVSIAILVLAACARSASTPPGPTETPNPMQLTLQAAGTALMQSTAEVAIRETDIAATLTAIESAPTDPPLATATEEPEAVSIFSDMDLDDYGYEGREWAFNQGYIPGCTVQDGSPNNNYSCHGDGVPLIGMIISGVWFYHEDAKFVPPAPTDRAFLDPDFDSPKMEQMVETYFTIKNTEDAENTGSGESRGQESEEVKPIDPEAFADEASREHLLSDWFLTLPPTLHYIQPLRTATVCDGHIFVQYLVHGENVVLPQAPLEGRALEYHHTAPATCIRAVEKNIANGIFVPGPLTGFDHTAELTWAYWADLLKNGDAARPQQEASTPEPTISPTSSP